jgi:hypothetical protein
MSRAVRPVVRAAAVMLAILVAGCSHLPSVHWPWRPKPAPPPQPVYELVITGEGGATVSFPQYWVRNTLLIDLHGASGTGSLVLKPRNGASWPVRLAFRVTPGAIGVLEVRADQRTLLPITPAGFKPIDLELVPGIYTPRTAKMTVSWGPATAPAL